MPGSSNEIKPGDPIPEHFGAPILSKKSTTISETYAEINRLVYLCWTRYRSFRLLAAIMRTNRYSTVYLALIHSKNFVGCKRSHPTKEEMRIVSETDQVVLSALEQRDITVRKWCHARKMDLTDLHYYKNPNYRVYPFLKEDFPELYKDENFEPVQYKTAPLGSDRAQWFDHKKKKHIFVSHFFAIWAENKSEGRALELFNWRLSQVIVLRRLMLLLDEGVEAALTYPSTEVLPLSSPGGKKAKRVPVDNIIKAQLKKEEAIMRRDNRAKMHIERLAKLRKMHKTIEEENEIRLLTQKLEKEYGFTPEQIRNEVDRIYFQMHHKK